jgi:hypothetical protein
MLQGGHRVWQAPQRMRALEFGAAQGLSGAALLGVIFARAKPGSCTLPAMHTIMVVGLGLCLLAACLIVGRVIGKGTAALGRAALVFVPLWFIGAAINLWIGVARAGYSVADEAPIFLLVFAVPTAIALLVRRKLAA